MDMHTAELDFVKALAEATAKDRIRWQAVSRDDRDIWWTAIDGHVVEVEFMSFAVATGETCERVLATVCGLKSYFQVAAGTEGYRILCRMIAHPKAWESGISNLAKATARVRQVLETPDERTEKA